MKTGLAYSLTLSTNSLQPPFPMPKLPRTNSLTFIPKGSNMILQVNNYIQAAVKTLHAASSTGGTIMEQEILYFQFKIYKKVKDPAEWTSRILFLEATVASNPTYKSDTLFNETQSKFTNLLNQGLWHPSDKTPEEQTLAMVAQQHQQTKRVAKKITNQG